MEFNEFNDEMRRIEAMFGEKHYGNERKEMIWRRVRGFTKIRFRAVCDELIGSNRAFPVVKDFDEASSKIREHDYAQEKREINEGLNKLLGDSKISELVRFTKDRIDGKIDDVKFHEYMAELNASIERENYGKSKPCCSDGMISARAFTNGNLFTFRCGCARGNSFYQIPVWKRELLKDYEVVG